MLDGRSRREHSRCLNEVLIQGGQRSLEGRASDDLRGRSTASVSSSGILPALPQMDFSLYLVALTRV